MKKNRILALLVCLVLVAAFVLPGTYARYVGRWGGRQGVTAQKFSFESDYLTTAGPAYDVYGESVSFRVTASAGAEFTVHADGELLRPGTDGAYTLSRSEEDITVRAECTSPYSKVLRATFHFKSIQTGYYTLTDGTNHVTLDIYTGDAGYSGTISYGTALAPDNTNSLMKEWISKTSGALDLAANAHYELIFFKNDTAAYNGITNGTLDSTITLS